MAMPPACITFYSAGRIRQSAVLLGCWGSTPGHRYPISVAWLYLNQILYRRPADAALRAPPCKQKWFGLACKCGLDLHGRCSGLSSFVGSNGCLVILVQSGGLCSRPRGEGWCWSSRGVVPLLLASRGVLPLCLHDAELACAQARHTSNPLNANSNPKRATTLGLRFFHTNVGFEVRVRVRVRFIGFGFRFGLGRSG